VKNLTPLLLPIAVKISPYTLHTKHSTPEQTYNKEGPLTKGDAHLDVG